MIARIWHGWTTKALADTYENLLRTEIFPGIFAKRIAGFLRIELFRRELEEETEFMTIMWFASPEAITDFVGPDHGVVYVPESARRVLARFDQRSAHYELRASREAPA
jgi:heme-degrading monooxygenase HmoA